MEMLVAMLAMAVLAVVGGAAALVLVAFFRAQANARRLGELQHQLRLLAGRLHTAELELRSRRSADAQRPAADAASVPPPAHPKIQTPRPTTPRPAPPPIQPPRPTAPPISRPEPPPRPTAPRTSLGDVAQPSSLTPTATAKPEVSRGLPHTSNSERLPAATPSGGTLEEALGGKVLVWIGGVALALAGAFLVKYSWDAGWLSAATRLILAAVFGGALIGMAAWVRTSADRVAAALAGAGVAVLYGVVFAATSVHELLHPVVGFALMAAVTAGAVLLSLQHGRFVAMLGLIGGFLTPALVGRDTEATGALFAYLLVLQIGLVVITRQRGWIGLSALTLIGSLAWALIEALRGDGVDERLWSGGFALASAAVFILNAARVQARDASGAARPLSALGMAVSAVAAAAALLGISTVRGGYGPGELGLVAALGIGTLVLARVDRRYAALPWLAAGMSLALTVSSRFSLSEPSLLRAVAGFGVVFVIGGWCGAWRNARGTVMAVLSAVAGPAFLFAAVLPDDPIRSLDGPVPSWVPAALVGVYAVGAWALRAEQRGARGALVLSAAGLATWTAGMAVDRPWLFVAWAALVPATWLVAELARTSAALRWSAVWNGALAGLGLLAAVAVPAWAQSGTTAGVYGGCAAAFALGAWRFVRGRQDAFAGAFASAAAVALWLGAARLFHQSRHGEEVLALPDGLSEWSVYVSLTLAFGVATLWSGHGVRIPALRKTGEMLGGVGLALGLIALLWLANPLLTGEAIGSRVMFNRMLPAYGLPILLAGALGVSARRVGASETGSGALVTALVWLFALAMLMVRHGFHRNDLRLTESGVGLFEWATYSVTFLASGLVLLLIGNATLPSDNAHDDVATPPPRRVGPLVIGGAVLAAAGAAVALLGAAGIGNPLWNDDAVGGRPIVNGLLYVFGGPTLLAALAASWCRSWLALRPLRIGLGVAALLLGFVLVSLEVRQYFAGPVLALQGGAVDEAEWYAYSAAWAALGAVLLLGGLALRSAAMRYGSLAVFMLAAGKVFVLDTGQLDGLLRVASFLGLGLTLMGLGFVYQRYVFRSPPAES